MHPKRHLFSIPCVLYILIAIFVCPWTALAGQEGPEEGPSPKRFKPLTLGPKHPKLPPGATLLQKMYVRVSPTASTLDPLALMGAFQKTSAAFGHRLARRTARIMGENPNAAQWLQILNALALVQDQHQASSISLHLAACNKSLPTPLRAEEMAEIIRLHEKLTPPKHEAVYKIMETLLEDYTEPGTYLPLAHALVPLKNLERVHHLRTEIASFDAPRSMLPELFRLFSELPSENEAQSILEFVTAYEGLQDQKLERLKTALCFGDEYALRMAVDLAHNLLQDEEPISNSYAIVQCFASHPTNFATLFDAAWQFKARVSLDKSMVSILQALKTTGPDKWGPVAIAAQKFPNPVDEKLWPTIINAMSSIHLVEEMDVTCSLAVLFLPPRASAAAINQFFNFCQDAQFADKERLLAICEDMDATQRESIYTLLADLDSTSRQTVFQFVLPDIDESDSSPEDRFSRLWANVFGQTSFSDFGINVGVSALFNPRRGLEEIQQENAENVEHKRRHEDTKSAVLRLKALMDEEATQAPLKRTLADLENYAKSLSSEEGAGPKVSLAGLQKLKKVLYRNPKRDPTRESPSIEDNRVFVYSEQEQAITIGDIFQWTWDIANNMGRFAKKESRDAAMANAPLNFVKALIDCVDSTGKLVCDNGKAQRMLSVLQGYIDGIQLDANSKPSPQERLAAFCLEVFKNNQPNITLEEFDERAQDTLNSFYQEDAAAEDRREFLEGIDNLRDLFMDADQPSGPVTLTI